MREYGQSERRILSGEARGVIPDHESTPVYDVFVSYRQREPDLGWVRKRLLPALKEQGLKVCIDFECFRLGAHLMNEMERAVLQSRYTLAVLSPDYLESNWTELENVLAEHLGAENRERRLIAVMRRDCKPGLRFRARLWLDMQSDAAFEEALGTLVRNIRLPSES